MKYILSQEEIDALTPVKRLQDRNDALEKAREIIVKLSGIPCGKTYCDMCPIAEIGGDLGHLNISEEDRPSKQESRLICIKSRIWSR